MLTKNNFRAEIRRLLTEVEERGSPSIELNLMRLHTSMGGQNEDMLVCSEAMHDERNARTDQIIRRSDNDLARLTIRYSLRRRRRS
jgi:hypothetical protein